MIPQDEPKGHREVRPICSSRPALRAFRMQNKNTARVRRETLRISSVEVPGWSVRTDRVPEVGDFVHCVEGLAKVNSLHGRTSDGSRLIGLALVDSDGPAFFAAASNVLQKDDEA